MFSCSFVVSAKIRDTSKMLEFCSAQGTITISKSKHHYYMAQEVAGRSDATGGEVHPFIYLISFPANIQTGIVLLTRVKCFIYLLLTMPVEQSEPQIEVVDSSASLQCLLRTLLHVPTPSLPLYIDLEGIKLGRHGSISILTLYVHPETIYLIDIYKLRETAFTTALANGVTLQKILESPSITKVIFDARNDSDALFAHYKISLDGVQDLQLMELATRKRSKKYVSGLAKCIEKESPASAAKKREWKRQKENTGRLFDPSKGGRYEIFNECPLRDEVRQYCAGDVALLPGLYHTYNAKLNGLWRGKVQAATKDRIKLSQGADYDGNSRSKTLGPWDEGNDDDLFGLIENMNVLDEDLYGQDEYDFDDWYDYQDNARECIGWEEDMIKNGSPF